MVIIGASLDELTDVTIIITPIITVIISTRAAGGVGVMEGGSAMARPLCFEAGCSALAL
jgi:hypothetical protein